MEFFVQNICDDLLKNKIFHFLEDKTKRLVNKQNCQEINTRITDLKIYIHDIEIESRFYRTLKKFLSVKNLTFYGNYFPIFGITLNNIDFKKILDLELPYLRDIYLIKFVNEREKISMHIQKQMYEEKDGKYFTAFYTYLK